MKKALKCMSIFLLLFIYVLGFSLSDESEVYASGLKSPITDKKNIFDSNQKQYGELIVAPSGDITIKYLYGYTELLIQIRKCQTYNSEKTACQTFSDSNIKVIHYYGDKNTTGEMKTKKIRLSGYSNGDIVEIKAVTSFLKTSQGQQNNTGDYEPLYCRYSGNQNIASCTPEHGTSVKRVEEFLCDDQNNTDCLSKYNIEYKDGSVIYKGPFGEINNFNCETVYVKVGSKGSGSSHDDGENSAIENIIYDTVIPVLMVALGIMAGVSIAVLGYKIVQSSDSPSERQEHISRLRSILIGLGLAMLLLFGLEPVTNFIRDYIG